MAYQVNNFTLWEIIIIIQFGQLYKYIHYNNQVVIVIVIIVIIS